MFSLIRICCKDSYYFLICASFVDVFFDFVDFETIIVDFERFNSQFRGKEHIYTEI